MLIDRMLRWGEDRVGTLGLNRCHCVIVRAVCQRERLPYSFAGSVLE
eukprot:COSAG05_NODE_2002_length_3720_cov_11.469207_2_plen_47_part_00